MSDLLSEAMEDFVLIDVVSVPDGESGFIDQYQDGAKIKAAIVLNSSMEAQIAMQLGVKSVYTITTRKNVNLKYDRLLRRVSNGTVFRVTSKGDDNKTPASAGLDMRQVAAEEYTLGGTGA